MQLRTWRQIYLLLLLIFICVLLAIFQFPDQNLHIVACDVGQGDAILITYGTTQILTDGGPDNSVLTCLGHYMPFWDHEIELVISTHPDADHATGLIDVLQAYEVDKVLINPIDSGTPVYQALVSEVGGRGVSVINPTSGMELGLGLIYLDILSPTQEMYTFLPVEIEGSNLAKYKVSEETNLYSIVYKLSFKNFSGLFPGDIQSETSDKLAAESVLRDVEYIKIPHHGSVNGLTENLLKTLVPKIAFISVGENSWGHPRMEILEMLIKYNVKTLRTDQMGDVELVTDGEKYWISR